jgi:hypothetical protein
MSARVISVLESKYRATLDDAGHDPFSCCCCGAGLLEDGMCCPECEAAGCGEEETTCLAQRARVAAKLAETKRFMDETMAQVRAWVGR